MTNQLETAKEWLSDLNKIIDKTDNECTKQKRDVLEWLVESVEELEKANKENYWIASDYKFENLKLEQQNKRYREAIIETLHGLKTLPSVAPRLYLISILDKALEGDEE